MTLRIPLAALLALVALLAAPGLARAAGGEGLTSVRAFDVPLHGGRSLAAAGPAGGFELVGLHWRGTGSVEVRVERADGSWGPWLADAATADGPDPGSAEAQRARGWRLGEPLWVGHATRFQVRARGRVVRARAWTVRSRISRVPTRVTTSAGMPPVVTRAQWLADERIRRDDPEIAPTLRFAVVHHTAGPNTYTRDQAPAVVRGIMAYHVQSNGWDDIGYNALVDRFGTVYEGRYGGLDRNVVGAHAKGFNTGSFGIAVMGDFTASEPAKAALDGLARMLAWRLDLAHVDPLATLQVVSGGSERYQPGVPVALRAISGHRDTGLTTCPGDRLYARLGQLAQRVAAIGLPKLYDPAVSGTWGGTMTITARLSGPLAWTVTVTGPDGVPVGTTTGSGADVKASFETAGLDPGAYAWRIEAPGVTPATGTLATATASAALAFTAATATPTTISPNDDGTLDTAAITYRLAAPANVSATVVDALGSDVATIESARWRRAGEHTLVFDGAGLADGAYSIRLDARGTGGQTATTSVPVAVSRTLLKARLTTPVLTPNGDGRSDRLEIRFGLATTADVRVRIFRGDRWVTTPFDGPSGPGPQVVEWDGTRPSGTVQEGDYTAVLEVTDPVATSRVDLPFVTDGTPPRVRLLSVAPPRIWVSEAATLRIVVNGLWRRLDVTAPGAVRLPWVQRVRTLLVVARDRAGNVGQLRR